MSPVYVYQCNGCGETFEVKQGFHDDPFTACRNCGDPDTASRVIQAPLHVSVRLGHSEIKNLGHLGERNREGMSADERAMLSHKHVTKKIDSHKDLPDGMSTEDSSVSKDVEKARLHKKINAMTPEQKKDYVEKGTG